MKNVAILISGHTRDFERTLPELVELKKTFNADIFISSYSDRGTGVRYWLGQQGNGEMLTDKQYSVIDSQLNPIKAVYEDAIKTPSRLSDYKFNDAKIKTEGVYGMFYKFWHVNELKKQYEIENDFKYSTVIRTRFDIEYLNLNLDKQYKGEIYTGRADIKQYMTDSFFISDSETFDSIAQIKEDFNKEISSNKFHNAEHMLTDYVIRKGFTPVVNGSIKVKLRDKLFV